MELTSPTALALLRAQDDNDTVRLPNACPGALVQFDDADAALVRCFSAITKQPHMIAPEHLALVDSPTEMPVIDGQPAVHNCKFLVDHVTRGIIGDNALQLEVNEDGALVAMRLLPPGEGKAQEQWEAQAKRMIE
jgi:hypothetical protein